MSDDNEVFYWQHSYSRVFTSETSYSPTDGFMSFQHYNVEIRDRVKCISAAEGRRHYFSLYLHDFIGPISRSRSKMVITVFYKKAQLSLTRPHYASVSILQFI